MAEIRPFRAVLYDPTRVSMADVVSPPYDVISEELRERLYKRSIYNILHIDYGMESSEDDEVNNRYIRAGRFINEWLGAGILKIYERPAFYGYEIDYIVDGEHKRLKGIICLLKLEDFGRGNVHPHEATHSKPKIDRFLLMKECRGNISPIFCLYKSYEKRTSGLLEGLRLCEPYISFNDFDGMHHRLWMISKEEDIRDIMDELSDKPVYIADGHHRYEVALDYRNEMLKSDPSASIFAPFNYVMVFLANIADEGITILPTHRLVRRMPENWKNLLSGYFDIIPFRSSGNELIMSIRGRTHTIGLRLRNENYILRYKGRDLSDIHPALRYLDVTILHRLIFEKLLRIDDVHYEMDIEKISNVIDSGEFESAFILNPTKLEEVETVALSSLRMPPKSTYFYPKLKTGITINLFDYSFDSRDGYRTTPEF